MPNRDEIVHKVQKWEDLLTVDDPIEVMPALCTATNPLTLNMSRKLFVTIVKDWLRAVKASRAKLDAEDGFTAESDRWVAQCKELLAWVKTRPKKSGDVYVALYPRTIYEFVDEDEGDGDISVVDCPPVLPSV